MNIGEKAPDYLGTNEAGKEIRLSDYKGKKVVLYFYPKDMTSGCTAQACGFGELYPQFTAAGAVVIGISKDSSASHKKFAAKYQLPCILLADEGLEVLKQYGVYQLKKLYGKESLGVVRTTYLIDEEGIIRKVLTKVKAKDNPAEMLELVG